MSIAEEGASSVQIDSAEQARTWLLTPGPLTTSPLVRNAMLRDWGSRDMDFRQLTASVREQLLGLIGADAAVSDDEQAFECVPLQGSGTYVMEAMLGSFVPVDGKSLVLVNGAYGRRIATTLDYLGREHVILDKGDYLPPRGDEIGTILDRDPAITHVIAVHCETSSGILNPIEEISATVYARGRKLLIDSMSALGALPLSVDQVRFEAVASSANKCIEGVPGFGYVLARRSELKAAQGRSHSLSLDVHAQWQHMEKTGQWRFTPPTHTVAAFAKALELHTEEGGVAGRLARYRKNCHTLVSHMRQAGFVTLLDGAWQAPVIVAFFTPADPAFVFADFYSRLKARGFVIYPGKLTAVDSFRMGCMGCFDDSIMAAAAAAAAEVLVDMGVASPVPGQQALQTRQQLLAQDAAEPRTMPLAQ